jgi:hypothetical protein
MEERGEHGANLAVVAAVGVEEKGGDGVEDEELAIREVVECAKEGRDVSEIEKHFGVGAAFGGIAAGIEDADVFECCAVSDEAGTDDLIRIVLARAEKDGAFVRRGNRIVGCGGTGSPSALLGMGRLPG